MSIASHNLCLKNKQQTLGNHIAMGPKSNTPNFSIKRHQDRQGHEVWTFLPTGPVSQKQWYEFEVWLETLLQALSNNGIITLELAKKAAL